jgi:hypothetical protein
MAAMANRVFFLVCTARKGKVAVDFVARRGVRIHGNGFSDLILILVFKERDGVGENAAVLDLDDAG